MSKETVPVIVVPSDTFFKRTLELVIVDAFIVSPNVAVGATEIETLVDPPIGVTELIVGAVVSQAAFATTSYVNDCSNDSLLAESTTFTL